MKIEVLKSIKQSEEEYTTLIHEAKADREQKLAAARLEAEHLIAKAHAEVEEYRKRRLSDARDEAARRRAEAIKEGNARAESLRSKGMKNLDKALALLTSRFEEQFHAKT